MNQTYSLSVILKFRPLGLKNLFKEFYCSMKSSSMCLSFSPQLKTDQCTHHLPKVRKSICSVQVPSTDQHSYLNLNVNTPCAAGTFPHLPRIQSLKHVVHRMNQGCCWSSGLWQDSLFSSFSTSLPHHDPPQMPSPSAPSQKYPYTFPCFVFGQFLESQLLPETSLAFEVGNAYIHRRYTPNGG